MDESIRYYYFYSKSGFCFHINLFFLDVMHQCPIHNIGVKKDVVVEYTGAWKSMLVKILELNRFFLGFCNNAIKDLCNYIVICNNSSYWTHCVLTIEYCKN